MKKINADKIINLLESIEEYFKEDLTQFKDFVKESNYSFDLKDNRIMFSGYYEINDFYRRYLQIKTPIKINRGKIKFLLKENDNCNFYDYKNQLLFSIASNENYFDIKDIDLKVFANFCY